MDAASEKIKTIIKDLEGVYKTSMNEIQKKRVVKDILTYKNLLSRINSSSIDRKNFQNSLKKYEKFKKYEILSLIPIEEIEGISRCKFSETYTFFKYLEREYLGFLGKYHLKLDHTICKNRESFYSELQSLLYKNMANYLEFYLANLNNISSDKTKINLNKKDRELLVNISRFLNKLCNFVNILIKDYDNGGSLILNPDDILHFQSVNEVYVLEGISMIEALKDLHLFVNELIHYVNPLKID